MLPQNIHESLKKNLLESVVKMVFEQIDKDFYNFKENNKKDINFIFKTLDQYNIVEEFENTIATTVFDSNDYVFVFVGNAPDLKNYQIYLQQKKANFQTPRGVFWRNWQPANMIFVSKKHIQFLINILQQIISLEMENHLIHKNTNFDTNAESIRNFQINIQNNRQQINKLKNELGRERCLNISINNEMLDLQ
jgi:hypothetical protein